MSQTSEKKVTKSDKLVKESEKKRKNLQTCEKKF